SDARGRLLPVDAEFARHGVEPAHLGEEIGDLHGVLPDWRGSLGTPRPDPRSNGRRCQSSRSAGTLPPLAAMRSSTFLCSHMFICAESDIRLAGQPSSVASSLRALRLLSMSSSLSRSTIEVRQLSFWGLAAARCSSWATTSTTGIACPCAGAAGAAPPVGALVWAGVSAACALPMPSLSRILLKKPMVVLREIG